MTTLNKKYSLFLITSLLLISNVSSLILDRNTSSIEETYAINSQVRGKINLSLSGDSSELLIKTNFGGNISLLELLKRNNARYSCFPETCTPAYEGKNPSGSQTISISAGEKKEAGFSLDNIVTGIANVSFSVSAGASSCASPLEVDILNDSAVEFSANETTSDYTCSHARGCFNESAELQEITLTNKKYCERVTLKKTRGVKLFGYISGDENITFYLLNSGTSTIGSCTTRAVGGFQEIGCPITANIEAGDYYVCASGNSNSRIKYETTGENCGFFDTDAFQGNYAVDYFLFASEAKYAPVGTIKIMSDLIDSIRSNIMDYLQDIYRKNCTKKCYIPITLTSGAQQEVSISNLKVDYTTPIGPAITTSIVQLEKKPAELFLNSTLIDIEKAGFDIPSEEGNKTLILTIGDTSIEKKIYISKAIVILALTPTTGVAGKSTDFVVKMQNSSKIKKYIWNFGDATGSVETNNNKAAHRYNRTGTFDITLRAVDEKGFSASKSFSIAVLNPKDTINRTLALYKSWVDASSKQIDAMPLWYAQSVREILQSDEWSENLKDIERDYVSAISESDYIKAMEALDALTIPSKINITALKKTPALVTSEDIELSILKEAGAGESDEQDYTTAIEKWFNNLNAIVEYKEIRAYYDDNIETIGIAGTIKINKETGTAFLVFDNPSTILNTGKAKKINEMVSLEAENLKDFSVEFFIPENIDLQEPIFYASPELSSLDISTPVACNNNRVCEKEQSETKQNCPNDCKSASRSLIYVGIILIIGVGAYFGLRWWYKWKYESYLFKNRADLANLMSFTRNAFEQGKDEREVIKLLRENSWNSEQIAYAVKKTIGKDTGMP